MNPIPRGRSRAIWVATALSLLFHGLALWIDWSPPASLSLPAPARPGPPLDVRLARPKPLEAPVAQAPEATPPTDPRPQRPRRDDSPRQKPQARVLRAPPQRPTAPQELARRPEQAPLNEQERKFFDEIAPPKPPPQEALAQRAIGTARQIAREEAQAARQEAQSRAQEVDPHSMELYVEAFLRKLNRSAPFVERERNAEHGQRVAVVQVNLNANGTLKSYKVLSAGDQQAEIAFVRSVVERAAPFAAFPPDIRSASSSLSFNICILPPRPGFGSGMFSRSFGGQACDDAG